jgi:hypothetical protein
MDVLNPNTTDTGHVNPSLIYESVLHNLKVGVWCAISAKPIDLLTYFFAKKPSVQTDTLITFLITFPLS